MLRSQDKKCRRARLAGGRSERDLLEALFRANHSRPLGRSRREREPVPRRVFQQVKLTEDEQQQLRARAAALGVSVPRLMVESALGGATGMAPDRQREVAELFEVRRVLSTVANNVNQLARLANTTGELGMQDRLEEALAEIEEVVGRVRAMTGARR